MREKERKPIHGAFRVRCLRCGNVAESWHRYFARPRDATVGVVHCACGQLAIDSLGFAGKGHVWAQSADSFEVLDD